VKIVALMTQYIVYESYIHATGCSNSILREEHRLRVFENRVLGRIFGAKRDEMFGSWRKLNNEELHNLYSSPNIIRMTNSMGLKWAGYLARVGEKWMAHEALVGNLEVKRLLEGNRR
jgi:hypothetical protein